MCRRSSFVSPRIVALALRPAQLRVGKLLKSFQTLLFKIILKKHDQNSQLSLAFIKFAAKANAS
jgi:hypothetical protein